MRGRMADVQAIVAYLNAPPLHYCISLLEFSQRSSQQLRQLLIHVLCFISPNQKKYLESESLEGSTGCIMELLRAFNYCPNVDAISFRQGMASGSTDVIYPILAWLLPQIMVLKKHSYLSQFLADVEIPGALLMDDDVNVLQAQCDALREHFKTNYCRLQSLHELHTEKDPAALKEHVQKLEAEKHHLVTKISKMRNKLQNVAKLDQMLELVDQFRGEFGEEANFMESVKEQKEALSAAAGKYGKAVLKLEYIQALATSPPHFIVDKVAQEILMLRYLAKTKLPKELEAKQRHFQALQNVISNPNYSDDKISRIQAKLVAANNELKSLRKRSSFDRRGENLGVLADAETLQCQQSAMVADRLKSAFEKLTALTQKREQLVLELSQKNKVIDEVKGTVLRGEELKQFVDSLRGKSIAYRTMKKNIDDLVSEYGVLRRTQQRLEQQASVMPGPVVPGVLNEFSESKNGSEELDKAIGTVTSLIGEVNATIKENKLKLSPKVKLLQTLRKTKQDLETGHSEKKHHYLEFSSEYERKGARLENEVESIRKEFALENRQYQEKCAEAEALESSLDELSKEEQGSSVSAGFRTKLQQQEDLKSTLDQRQQKLKDVEQYNQLQMAMMKDLVTILSAKLKQYSSASRPAIYSSVTTLETDEDRPTLP